MAFRDARHKFCKYIRMRLQFSVGELELGQIKWFLFWKNNWLFNICQSSCFCTLSQIWWSKLSSIYCEDAHQLRITILLFVNHPTRRQTSCCIIFWIFQMLCHSYPCCSTKNLKSVIQTPKVLTKITLSKLRLRFGWLKFLLSRFNKVLFPITLTPYKLKILTSSSSI